MKQVCETKKIRKTSVYLLNFYKYKFDCFLIANEIANSYFEICLKRRKKRQERITHRTMQKFNKYTDVFRIFFSFYKLVPQVKIH